MSRARQTSLHPDDSLQANPGVGIAMLRYGVFLVENVWRLYSSDGRARNYPCQATAILAGKSATRAAVAQGREVELYVQDNEGNLSRIDPPGLGH